VDVGGVDLAEGALRRNRDLPERPLCVYLLHFTEEKIKKKHCLEMSNNLRILEKM
jgi:hypothetical protein